MFQRATFVLILVYISFFSVSLSAKSIGKLPQRTKTFNRESDSLALVALANANPKWKSRWDFSVALDRWDYIKLENNRVISIRDYWGSFQTLTKDIGDLTKLQRLEFQWAKFQQMPKEFGYLKELKYLKIQSKKSVQLSGNMKELSGLDSLVLNYPLSDVPKEIRGVKNLKHLTIALRKNKTLPSAVYGLTHLEGLKLFTDSLSSFSPNITKLKSLKSLYIYSAKLKTVPKELFKLTQLEKLEIKGRVLTVLPKEIGKLKNLTLLTVKGALTSLPPEIGDLASLKSLDIGNNNLTKLPREMKKLPKLDWLQLSSNDFSDAEISFARTLRAKMMQYAWQKSAEKKKAAQKKKTAYTTSKPKKSTYSKTSYTKKKPATIKLRNDYVDSPFRGMIFIPAKGVYFNVGNRGTSTTMNGVTLSQKKKLNEDYFLGKTEVTQKEYHEIMSATYKGYKKPKWDVVYGIGDEYPAYNVGLYDAILYCNGLSKKHGLDTAYSYDAIEGVPGNGCILKKATYVKSNGFRLPNRLEWEFACRGGSASDYHWGKDTLHNKSADMYAVWNNNAGKYGKKSPLYGAHKVATKRPNHFGLYDMSGNVYEWLGSNYSIARGGSWSSRDLKVGTPFYISEENTQRTDVGFRVLYPYSGLQKAVK